MGCDIHLFVEDKTMGYWEVNENIYFDEGRDYDLFSVIADVRNNGGVKPISQPRGIPNDLSDEVENYYEKWKGDLHSHSYFTLKELKEVDWNKSWKQTGFLNQRQYEDYLKTNEIKVYYWGTSSKDNVISDTKMKAVINKKIKLPQVCHWPSGRTSIPGRYNYELRVKKTWDQALGDYVGKDFMKLIDEMDNNIDADTEDIRIVFAFDN